MAEVTARKRGSSWSYSFELARVDGKRRRKEKGGFRTKKEALEAGVKAKSEYDNSGQTFTPSEISVADYMDYWISNYVKINCSLNTLEAYEGIVKNHIKPKLGTYKLKSITPAILQEFINDIHMRGYSKNMMVNIKSVLSGSFEYAADTCKFISDTPATRIKLPKFAKKKKERSFVTPEQFDKIVTRFDKDTNFYLPIMLGYHCGLRIGECFGLTWDCIDFKTMTLTVNKALNYDDTNKKWYYSAPKTKTSNRTILLGTTILNLLKKERIKQKENKLRYGEFYTSQYIRDVDISGRQLQYIEEYMNTNICAAEKVEPVCVKENGSMLTTGSFRYCSRVVHYELGIPEFDYHSLRHTHATILIENGANVKDVQERLGHTNIETTMNTYVHNTENIKKESVDIFERAIR